MKARALQLLVQREQSRAELRRKLLAAARAEAVADAAAAADAGADDTATAADISVNPENEVEAVLDWLEAHGYLSDSRFVESRVNARLTRFGNLRIRNELKQHATVLPAELASRLVATELDRARALLARRFTTGAAIDADADANMIVAGRAAACRLTAAERAKRARFLLGRGFSGEVVRRAVRAAAEPASYNSGDSSDDD